MEQAAKRSARLVAAGVWASGAILGVALVQYLGAWGDEAWALTVNDLARLPVTLLTAVLGLSLVRRSDLDQRERRAWMLLEVAFVFPVAAHATSLFVSFMVEPLPFPSITDYLYAAAIPPTVAGLLLLPAARRSRNERTKLLIDSLTVVVGACMGMWYLEIAPLIQLPGADREVIVFSAAVPVLDLLLTFALIVVFLRRSDLGPAVALLGGSVAVKVFADTTYTIAIVQFGVVFPPSSWPYLLWAAGDFVALLAVHQRLRQRGLPRGDRQRRRRVTWLPYGAIVIAYALLVFVGRKQSIYTLGGMIIGVIVLTALVIARQMLAQRENHRLAVTDPLTGLANRVQVGERLAEAVRQPARDGRISAVLLIDLDHFKPINDTYGHEAGDVVLRAVATALRAVIRSGDTAGRLGGDEFCVVLTDLPTRAAVESVAQRLVEALRTPVIFGDLVLTIEASIGVAFVDETTADAEQLIAHADVAMYAVKRSGRGAFRTYSPELDSRARDAELRRAVDNDELVVHFQPIVSLADGRAVEVEALVRWNHPARGLLMPGAFIELAEETGAIIPIGEWVLRESCRQVADWRRLRPELDSIHLSVNLSARQVTRPGLVDTVTGILRDTGFPADRLTLELTESAVLQPDEHIVARLTALRALGVRIAVDDFGTGYAALNYLRELPVNAMKIDRSFVAGIGADADAYAVTDAMVRLAKAYKLDVVAEGIETADQVRCLLEMGCGFGQGFHFARPAPGPVTADLLAAGQGAPDVDLRAVGG